MVEWQDDCFRKFGMVLEESEARFICPVLMLKLLKMLK